MVEIRTPRGHASADHRATVDAIASGRLLPGSRLPPPPDLSDAEQIEWVKLVGALPPGWIAAEHEPIMRQLCRHTVIAQRLGEKINRTLPDVMELPVDDERWVALRAMMSEHRCQSDAVMRLSRSLRITKQAQIEPRGAASKARKSTAASRPWNDWGRRASGPTLGKA